MKAFMLSPNFHKRKATKKNLAALPMIEAKPKRKALIAKAPALIVKILYGIGVKPAVKIMKKLYSS